MYALYGHPRYFKFKRKYQQYCPCFQTIFPFLMTMRQVRAGQWSITANFRPLTAHIYHVMIIVTGGFSRISFYYFLEFFLSDLEFVFLGFKHFYTTHRTSFFSFYLFILYSLFCNHSVY